MQVLTANRLKLGEVAYWNQGRWVSRLEEAELMSGSVAEAALKGAGEFVRSGEIVAPYLFEAHETAGRTVPVKVREAVRAAGPTVRTDLGKQADLGKKTG
jgi:hypothetical protein